MLGMIWAQGRDRAIGRGGTMAWHVPEDMAFFRRSTMGHPVIMGRKTWDSLGKYQPLGGRENIVVTRNPEFDAPGAHVAPSLQKARELGAQLSGGDLCWIMGGAQIYEVGLGLADILAVTEIDMAVKGADAFAPEFGGAAWELIEATPWREDATSGLTYRFTVYGRAGLVVPNDFFLLDEG